MFENIDFEKAQRVFFKDLLICTDVLYTVYRLLLAILIQVTILKKKLNVFKLFVDGWIEIVRRSNYLS